MNYLFIDGLKLDDSKKHLIFRPAYAKIDKGQGLVCIWDHGPNYSSFSEMVAQRREISPERIYAGLHSVPGLQFANRGLGVAKVLVYQGTNFLVTSRKQNTSTLQLINGYFGNGTGASLEREEIPANINVADSILRTAAIEDLEEFNVVHDGRILKGEVQIVKGSTPISFAPFEYKGFPYSNNLEYNVIPLENRLDCLTNLHPFPVAKVCSADDENPSLLGDNVGIYFDPFHNCYQIVTCVETNLNDIDELFHTEDKYRDNMGMDTFLHRDGIRLIKLNEKGKMIPEVYRIKEGRLDAVSLEGLFVAESLVPCNAKTGTVIAPSLPLNQIIEAQK